MFITVGLWIIDGITVGAACCAWYFAYQAMASGRRLRRMRR